MIFSSLKSLPPNNLGKKFYEWQFQLPWAKRIFWWAVLFGFFLILAYVYFSMGRENELIKRYSEVLFYIALPVFSILLPRAIAASRARTYAFHDFGFIIYYRDIDKPQPGAGWAFWKDFDRAELSNRGVKIFPKKVLLHSVSFPCENNRLTVYSYVAEKIAQFRYRRIPNNE